MDSSYMKPACTNHDSSIGIADSAAKSRRRKRVTHNDRPSYQSVLVRAGMTSKRSLAALAGIGLALALAAGPAAAASSQWNNAEPELSDVADGGASVGASTRSSRRTRTISTSGAGSESEPVASGGAASNDGANSTSAGRIVNEGQDPSTTTRRRRTVSSDAVDIGNAEGLPTTGDEPTSYRAGNRWGGTNGSYDAYSQQQLDGENPWRQASRRHAERRHRSIWFWWGNGENN